MIATSLLGFAGWQAMRIAVGQRMIGAMPTLKGPPTKVRSDGRLPKALAADPVQAYISRSKRGMTDREIRWVIEDFRKADLGGKDSNSVFEFSPDIRLRQQQWYLEALAEALQLTPKQKAQATARMKDLLQMDLDAFAKGIAAAGALDSSSVAWISNSVPLWPFGDSARLWLSKPAYLPWNLVDLSPEQERLTSKTLFGPSAAVANNEAAPEGKSPALPPPGPDMLNPIIQDPTTGTRTARNWDRYSPYPRDGFLPGSSLLPIIPDQISPMMIQDFVLPQTRLLQPAQLKLALLIDPRLAKSLEEQMDHELQSKKDSPPTKLSHDSPQPPVVTEPKSPSE